MKMFTDDFLERIFSHPDMQKIPIGCQSTAVNVFSEIIEEIEEENPYASIQSVLQPDANVSTTL
jgi:hypothetical protein